MIQTMSISDYKFGSKFDAVYLVVRSLSALHRRCDPILSVAKWLPQLSPEQALYKDYLFWKSRGKWNVNTFETIYRKHFIEQIINDSKALAALVELAQRSEKGESIALLCYCKNVNLCHRKILGEILQSQSVNIQIT